MLIGSEVRGSDFQKGLNAYYRGNFATALREWIPIAKQGNADAQFNLGEMYNTGKGVPQDYKTAVKWYKLAAEQGSANAQYSLGHMYLEGNGVSQNYETAVKWYKLAAKQGNNFAQMTLGRMYHHGQGVPQNNKTAMKWYKLAVEQGFAPAQRQLKRLRYFQEQEAQKQAEEEAKRAAEERAAARAKEIRMAEERAAKAKRIRMAEDRAAHAKAEPKVNLQSERGQYSYQAQKGNEVSNQSSNLAELIMTIIAVIFLLISLVSVVYLARMATKPNVVVYANKIDLLKNVAVTWVPLLGAFMLLIYLEEMGDFAAYSLIFPVLAMAGIGYLVFSTSIKMNESRPMMLVKAGELVEDLNLSQARRRCISIGLAKIVSGFVLGVCSVFLGFMFLGKVNAANDEKTSLQSFAMLLAVFAACVGAFTWILRLLINGERVKLCDRILERQLTKDEFSDQAKSGVLDKRSIKLGFEIFENLEIAKARNQEAKS